MTLPCCVATSAFTFCHMQAQADLLPVWAHGLWVTGWGRAMPVYLWRLERESESERDQDAVMADNWGECESVECQYSELYMLNVRADGGVCVRQCLRVLVIRTVILQERRQWLDHPFNIPIHTHIHTVEECPCISTLVALFNLLVVMSSRWAPWQQVG